jgi:hypothetical protein
VCSKRAFVIEPVGAKLAVPSKISALERAVPLVPPTTSTAPELSRVAV